MTSHNGVMAETGFKSKLCRRTRSLRHGLVKRIAPRLFYEALRWEEVGDLPRPMIQAVRETFDDRPLVGVEIGVAKGFNAESILQTLNMRKLYLVDPYVAYLEETSGTSQLVGGYVSAKKEAANRLSRFGEKVCFHYLPSEEAINMIPEKLDFVYIDGNHSYANVKNDAALYSTLVKAGGFLGGHDYKFGGEGVVRAVDEFAETKGFQLHTENVDWWVTCRAHAQNDSELTVKNIQVARTCQLSL